MSELKTNLEQILQEKETKIIPENIKKDIQIFDIIGTLESSSNIKLFETQEDMQADSTAKDGDLAIIYKEKTGNMTIDTQTQYITFPETVILSEAITSNYNNCIINSINHTGKMLSITLTPTEFQAAGYNNLGMVGVRYTSSDGITYTRTMLGGISGGGIDSSVMDLPNPLDFGTLIQCKTPELWNDNMGYFMQIEENFEGLYIYKTDTGYELANTQLSLTASNELLIGRTAYGKTGIISGTFQPLDTSSDNPITASDVASGKEGFVNGEKITGTLPLFPNTRTFTVSNAGVTNNTEDSTLELTTINTLKQTLDSNLNMKFSAPYADITTAIGLTPDKIKAGETILGITGTYTGETTE